MKKGKRLSGRDSGSFQAEGSPLFRGGKRDYSGTDERQRAGIAEKYVIKAA